MGREGRDGERGISTYLMWLHPETFSMTLPHFSQAFHLFFLTSSAKSSSAGEEAGAVFSRSPWSALAWVWVSDSGGPRSCRPSRYFLYTAGTGVRAQWISSSLGWLLVPQHRGGHDDRPSKAAWTSRCRSSRQYAVPGTWSVIASFVKFKARAKLHFGSCN